MWHEFDTLNGIVLVVLDEVDHLEDGSILYQLSRARENDHLDNSRVAVIGISNLTDDRMLSRPGVDLVLWLGATNAPRPCSTCDRDAAHYVFATTCIPRTRRSTSIEYKRDSPAES